MLWSHQLHKGVAPYLVGMDDDEEVVDAYSQNQEGDDLYDNEGDGDPRQVEEADGAHHGKQYHQHTEESNGDLHVNLEGREGGGSGGKG